MQSFPLGQKFGTDGRPLAGGRAYFRISGGTTATLVYEDAERTIALPNPVVADASGRFPELVYLDPSIAYRYILIAATGDLANPLESADPINTTQGAGGIDTGDINDGAITADKLADGAIEAKLDFTPANADDVSALLALIGAMTGKVDYFLRTTAPTGWVKANGGTIGDASSGGTTRANADTEDLFTLIWSLDATTFPITTSAGGASTRGADAASDFAAHKRLPLPDLRAEFVRGLDDGRGVDTAVARVVGSAQAGQFPAHTHTTPTVQTNMNSTGGTSTGGATGSGSATGSTGGTENASENRPRNVGLLACIKL